MNQRMIRASTIVKTIATRLLVQVSIDQSCMDRAASGLTSQVNRQGSLGLSPQALVTEIVLSEIRGDAANKEDPPRGRWFDFPSPWTHGGARKPIVGDGHDRLVRT